MVKVINLMESKAMQPSQAQVGSLVYPTEQELKTKVDQQIAKFIPQKVSLPVDLVSETYKSEA
jgi:hypothetical protein